MQCNVLDATYMHHMPPMQHSMRKTIRLKRYVASHAAMAFPAASYGSTLKNASSCAHSYGLCKCAVAHKQLYCTCRA